MMLRKLTDRSSQSFCRVLAGRLAVQLGKEKPSELDDPLDLLTVTQQAKRLHVS